MKINKWDAERPCPNKFDAENDVCLDCEFAQTCKEECEKDVE